MLQYSEKWGGAGRRRQTLQDFMVLSLPFILRERPMEGNEKNFMSTAERTEEGKIKRGK